MKLELIEAEPAHLELLHNLMQLYLYDFSEFIDLRPGPAGRFDPFPLESYLDEDDLWAFVVRADGEPAGFVLVHTGSKVSDDPDVLDVEEFFVLRGWRRRGIGSQIANRLWELLPGTWEVRVRVENEPALPFWERIVSEHTGGAFERSEVTEPRAQIVYRFTSPPA